MKTEEVLKELEKLADPTTKNTLIRHGAKEPIWGVKIGDMKTILKKTKKNHELSIDLYASGISDAMYLAGLMADEKKITKEQLKDWANKATWEMISDFTVPWVASETPYGFELGLEWIESKDEQLASCGWATLANYASINEDKDLDLKKYAELLERVANDIHDERNRVKYNMNSFVIAVGSYIVALTDLSKEIAQKIGKVDVNVGDTACKIPLATVYIDKVINSGRAGKKKKTARC